MSSQAAVVPPSHNQLSCDMSQDFGAIRMQDPVASDRRNRYISEASARAVYGLSQAEIDVAISVP